MKFVAVGIRAWKCVHLLRTCLFVDFHMVRKKLCLVWNNMCKLPVTNMCSIPQRYKHKEII